MIRTRTYMSETKKSNLTSFHRFSEIPEGWSYNKKTGKLAMLFNGKGANYLLVVKAKLSRDFGLLRFALSNDGTEYELWTDNMGLPKELIA